MADPPGDGDGGPAQDAARAGDPGTATEGDDGRAIPRGEIQFAACGDDIEHKNDLGEEPNTGTDEDALIGGDAVAGHGGDRCATPHVPGEMDAAPHAPCIVGNEPSEGTSTAEQNGDGRSPHEPTEGAGVGKSHDVPVGGDSTSVPVTKGTEGGTDEGEGDALPNGSGGRGPPYEGRLAELNGERPSLHETNDMGAPPPPTTDACIVGATQSPSPSPSPVAARSPSPTLGAKTPTPTGMSPLAPPKTPPMLASKAPALMGKPSLASAAAAPDAPAIQPSTTPPSDRHEEECEAECMDPRTDAEPVDPCQEPTVAAVTPAKHLLPEGDTGSFSSTGGVAGPARKDSPTLLVDTAEERASPVALKDADAYQEPTVAAVTPAKHLLPEGDNDSFGSTSGVADPAPEDNPTLLVDDTGKRASAVAREDADAHQEPTVAAVTPAKHLPPEGGNDRFGSTSGVAGPLRKGSPALPVGAAEERASPVALEDADAHQDPTVTAVTPAKHLPPEGGNDRSDSTSGVAEPARKGNPTLLVDAAEKRASPVALEDGAASEADARLTSTDATLLRRTSPAASTPASASIAGPGNETLGDDSPPPATNCESPTGNEAPAAVDHSLATLAKETARVMSPPPPETAVESGASSSSPALLESAASATSDDIATSTSTDANEEQDPKLGHGSSTATDVRGDTTATDTSLNDSPSANEESDIVAVNAQVKEAAKQALALGGKVPAPDWRICSTHDEKRRRDLWVLPRLRIQFDTRKGAFEFEEFRKILPDGPSALAAYKEMKRRLGEQPRVRALNCDLSQEEADRSSEEGAEGDPDQEAGGDPANFAANEADDIEAEGDPDLLHADEADECYVCEDGGELVCCDFCPKAFHTNCHIPRLQLDSIPPGAWKCMECLASSFKRKQRCGVCRECKRPDCGKCCCCRKKRSFGGDGKWGKPCKLKRCNNMRFASTEKPKAKVKSKAKAKAKSKLSTSAKVSTKRKPTGDQAIAVSKKPRLDHMASTMVQLAKGTPATPTKPSPGKGWVYKLATIAGDAQQRYVWLSPAHKILFKRRPAACIFEELRTKFGGDEVRAWQEYRMMRKGKDAHVVAPARYDAVPTQPASPQPIKPRKEPPGPGWVHKPGSNGKGRSASHWISPIRQIEFKSWEQALKFEELREEFGTDEVQAWEEYRKITKPLGDARVVAPGQYDDIYSSSHERPNSKKQEVATTASATRKSKQPLKQSPGKGWTCKRVLEASNPWPICYWSSPERGIEFKRQAKAAEFEALRKEYGNEFAAWEQYRKIKRGKDTYVVDPRQYDASCPKDHTSTKRSFEYVGSEADAKPRRQKKQKGTTQVDEKLAGLSPGWKTTQYPEGQKVRTRYMTPKLNLEFRSYGSAADFDSKSLKKHPRDEAKALDAYIEEVGREKMRAMVYSFGRYLPRWKDGSKNKDAQSKRSAETKKKAAAGPAAQSKSKIQSSKVKTSKSTAKMTKKTKSTAQDDEKLAGLSPGWKMASYPDGQKVRKQYISPKLNLEFRSYASAADFDSKSLKKHPRDEAKALDAYIEGVGREKFRAIVANFGRYLQRWKDGSNADTQSKRSAETKKKAAAGPVAQSKSKIQSSKVKTSKSTAKMTAKKKNAPRRSAPSKKISRNTEETNNNLVTAPFKPSPPPTPDDGLNCGEYKIVRMRPSPSNKASFFSHRFPGKILRIESSLFDDTPPDKTVTQNGTQYTLASAKVMNDKAGGPKSFGQDKKIELVYIRMARGLQKEFEKVCSFSLMRPEKAVARLAHLQSEAKKICYVDPSKIKIIPEGGHEGCGYYPEDFFQTSCDAIQVRVVGPQLGLAKGMLLKKKGISHIQLPKSMMKAPPSTTCNESWAAVVIKNTFPSEENKQLGRFLDPDEAATSSWQTAKKKQLSDMYQRMLIGYGVKKLTVYSYAKRSRSADKLRHAHLKGVIDPTGKIPQNKVFISGYTSSSGDRQLFGKVHRKVYLSRSPSLAPEDAKLLSVVGTKPKDMSAEDWNMLCSYDFGTIIFPKPRRGSVPLPCIIADGDLDGDDFFVLWDEKILNHLLHSKDAITKKSRKLLHKLELPSGVSHSVNKGTKYSDVADKKWLSKAQDMMLDFSTKKIASQMVGKLWSECRKASKTANGDIDIYNDDAVSFARAYKDALDVQKHGGKISLPEHLHEYLSEAQQELLTPT